MTQRRTIPAAEVAFAELAAVSEVAVVAIAVELKHPATPDTLFDACKPVLPYPASR